MGFQTYEGAEREGYVFRVKTWGETRYDCNLEYETHAIHRGKKKTWAINEQVSCAVVLGLRHRGMNA